MEHRAVLLSAQSLGFSQNTSSKHCNGAMASFVPHFFCYMYMISFPKRKDDHGPCHGLTLMMWSVLKILVNIRWYISSFYFVSWFQENYFLHLDSWWIGLGWILICSLIHSHVSDFSGFSPLSPLSDRLQSLPTGHKLWVRFGIWSTENEIWEHSTNTQLDSRGKGIPVHI